VPWLVVLALGLFAGAVAGTLVWAAALSPYGLVRFAAPVAGETARTVTINRPGTYLVFEEDPGASRAALPPALEITVRDDRSRVVPVTMLVEPGEVGAPFSYNMPPHEGRAIARFEASRKGGYDVAARRLVVDSADAAGYSGDPPDGLAVGRQLGMSWLRTPLGLLLLGGVPFVAGLVVLIVARRRRNAARTPAEPSEPSGSLPIHG
jgi:hypothetical protein